MMLEQLKRLLGITDNTQDALLTELLIEAQEYVEEFLQRKLDLADYEDYIEPGCASTLVVRNFPLESVASIETLDGFAYTEFKLVKPSGEIRSNIGFNGDLVINYRGGYADLPAWAKKAIVETAANLFASNGSGSSGVAIGAVKSEEIVGVAKVTYETGSSSSSSNNNSGGFGSIPGYVIDTLEPHRNRYA
jgi:hypothetical protein